MGLTEILFLLVGIIISLLTSSFIFKSKLKNLKAIVKNEIKDEVINSLEDEINALEQKKVEENQSLDEIIKSISEIQEKYIAETNRLKELQDKLAIYNAQMEQYGESLTIQEKIKEQKDKLKRLISEVMKYEDVLAMQEFGLYRPSFDFDTSEKFKQEIISIREEQKQQIALEIACICSTPWTVDGSRAKGLAMEKNAIKLAIRSFNNECDAVIAKVTFKNVNQSIERIRKSFEQINRLNARNDITLEKNYLDLKIKELKATYEYALKKEEERAEQQRIKDEMREELRVQKELEKARLDAEKKQREYEKELEYTKKLLEKDAQNSKLREKLAKLEKDLQEAIESGQRAISQAQLTKSGHVYVISNIGSFGEDVYKIGMTRRLEPLDRIRESGDASVPFSFDVHAMIYSNNAPELERELHRLFADKRINRVNPRKEFFKVPLLEIKEQAEKLGCEVEFTMLAEAKEYLESLSLEKEGKFTSLSESQYEDIDEMIESI
ncbi:DUF4041 domain-containing protein [Glaesserella parasuis]|nr:DUF4041 domain-containing protein [Glaesserella parasuis]